MSDIVQALGLAIRRLRDARGWSQEQLAEHADLNRSYVGEVERGQVIASIVTIEKIARALDVPAATLVHRTDPDSRPVDISRIRLAAIAC